MRRHLRYEQVTLATLANTIAQRHGLQTRTDVTQPVINIDQVDESDLNLLNRLAKEHGCIFNIKNATLYFMHREVAPPDVVVDINQCIDSDITHSNTTLYKSCKAIYHSTQRNELVTISVGSGEPVLTKQGQFSTDEEAMLFAQNALNRANQGTAEGNLTMPGQLVFAGSQLTLDGQAYIIIRVEHTVDESSWLATIEFNNKASAEATSNNEETAKM
ncbi:MAG: hypothetical protein PSN46_06695 [Gammaproteobacteria bacterium]|nr:hypothetical protein [Gammaproteobacteria bacterium]